MQKTVKVWLKQHEKTKMDGQDKADGQGESKGPPDTDEPSMNGVAVPDGIAPAIREEQPLAGAVESEETPADDVQPSIEVNSFGVEFRSSF